MATSRKKAKKPTSRPRPGRPTKLVPSVTKKILDALEDGATFEAACASAGVNVRTAQVWVAQGRTASATPAQRDFALAVERAKHIAESSALREIREGVNVAGMPDWRAREVWLRLMHPEKYGAKAVNERKIRAAVNEILSAVLNRISTGAAGEFLEALEVEYRLRGLLESSEEPPKSLPAGD